MNESGRTCLTPCRIVLLLMVAGGMLGIPIPGIAQGDPATVAVLQERLVALEQQAATCRSTLDELAHLLRRTGQFPHQYRRAEIEGFQQELAEATACLGETERRLTALEDALPRLPPPEANDPAAEALRAVHARFEALAQQAEALRQQQRTAAAQLDQLAKKLTPTDTTGRQLLIPINISLHRWRFP